MLTEDNVDIFMENMLDPRAIVQLKKIVDVTKAEIVLSSSWRWYEEERNEVHKQLQKYNIDFKDTTDCQTDITKHRGQEIQEYLIKHPEIENFVILDDDSLQIPEFLPHHVKTTFKYGLTREKAEQAIKILNGEINE